MFFFLNMVSLSIHEWVIKLFGTLDLFLSAPMEFIDNTLSNLSLICQSELVTTTTMDQTVWLWDFIQSDLQWIQIHVSREQIRGWSPNPFVWASNTITTTTLSCPLSSQEAPRAMRWGPQGSGTWWSQLSSPLQRRKDVLLFYIGGPGLRKDTDFVLLVIQID